MLGLEYHKYAKVVGVLEMKFGGLELKFEKVAVLS